MTQGHKRHQKRATLYNCDLQGRIALLDGVRGEEESIITNGSLLEDFGNTRCGNMSGCAW